TVAGAGLMMNDRTSQVLDRQKGRALRSDQETEVRSAQLQVDRIFVGPDYFNGGLQTELCRELRQELLGDAPLLIQCYLQVAALPLIAVIRLIFVILLHRLGAVLRRTGVAR